MRASPTLASLVFVGAMLCAACTGRAENPSHTMPPTSPIPTLAIGEIIPWADIPPPLATHPQPAIPPLSPSITAPATARPGEDLFYEVTLRNTTGATYEWATDCPVFLAILQTPEAEPRNVAGNHQQLNCAPARDLPPGGEARFEMRLFVPEQVPAGPWSLTWSFTATGLSASSPANANVTILR